MKRAPRLLLIAFALSLLVHLIVAFILHPPQPTPENQAEVVSIEHRPATIAVTKVPTPPPRPKRTPSPRVVSSAKPIASTGPGPASSGSSAESPAPTATPQPAATANGCVRANADAAVLETPPPPQIAVDARASGASGTTVVNVAIDATGQVTDASVKQSSGDSSLDLVAVSMARDARYSPALHDCKPVASAYNFSVKFVAW
ncbi:MAG TPA: TonB family protein [Candidatus Binatia bacterium]|nr:TonB family protein [Candidatus Binatia bacterium]